MRSRMDLPPTPSSSGSPSASPPQLKADAAQADDDEEEEVITVNATPRNIFVADNPDNGNCLMWPTAFCGKSGDEGVLDPQG